eukprot:SAG31_NODE_294_length_18242_cov_28.418949_13_plen_268_part_00
MAGELLEALINKSFLVRARRLLKLLVCRATHREAETRGVQEKCNDPEQVNIVIATLQSLQSLVQLTCGFVKFADVLRKTSACAQLAACLNSDDEDMRYQTLLVIFHAIQPMDRNVASATTGVDVKDVRASVFVEGSKGSKILDSEIQAAVMDNKRLLMSDPALLDALVLCFRAGLRSPSGHLVIKGVMDLGTQKNGKRRPICHRPSVHCFYCCAVNLYLLGSNQESTTRETYDSMLAKVGMHPALSAVWCNFIKILADCSVMPSTVG